MRIVLLTSLLIATGLAEKPAPPTTNPEHKADVEITGHIFKPTELPAPNVRKLRVAPGFKIEKYAENTGNARLLIAGPNGKVYLTRREQGDILMFQTGANGLAEGTPLRVASRSGLHGMAISKGKVYLASVHEVFKADLLANGTFGPLEMIIKDLPDAGQHNTRTVQIGPDDMMYISIGSTCNECAEPNPENATIVRATLDGKSRSIFASGLRDTIGWGWHPKTGEMWGMDHGIDWLGDDNQPEELNRIEKGKRYGWPYVYAAGRINPHIDPPGGLQKSEWAQVSTPMLLGYTAHAAPMQMAFYTGSQFPAEYRGDAFISMRGSWNRKPASGYEVVRIRFRDGAAVALEPFVTGFIGPEGEYGRLVGTAVAADGSLLFTDDRNGVIYRVSYAGGAAASSQAAANVAIPADTMLMQNQVRVRKPIAMQSVSAKTDGKLTVSSPSFSEGQTIPVINSAYDQNASPALRWSAGPSGTLSYVLLMEDPDAKTTPLPVVHWVAWNIPGEAISLREGLQAAERLPDMDGMRQGVNSMGVAGYRGPKPPAGDPPHRYHVEVFALDGMLNLPVGTKRDDVVQAMEGRVTAKGELTGLFQRPEKPAKP